jgi:uncharacterized membrane protein
MASRNARRSRALTGRTLAAEPDVVHPKTGRPGMVIRPDESVDHHPVVVAHKAARAANVQLRIADAITRFAGSMPFVYVHAVLFTVWMLFLEHDPWPKLTLVVSLEAIFLSTFVMIGQNRQAAFQQAKADHDFVEQEQELKTNTDLTRTIHQLTKEIHMQVVREHGHS